MAYKIFCQLSKDIAEPILFINSFFFNLEIFLSIAVVLIFIYSESSFAVICLLSFINSIIFISFSPNFSPNFLVHFSIGLLKVAVKSRCATAFIIASRRAS